MPTAKRGLRSSSVLIPCIAFMAGALTASAVKSLAYVAVLVALVGGAFYLWKRIN